MISVLSDTCVKRPTAEKPLCVGEAPQLTYLHEDPSKPSYSLPPTSASLPTESLERPLICPRRQHPTISGCCRAEQQENLVSRHLKNFSRPGVQATSAPSPAYQISTRRH